MSHAYFFKALGLAPTATEAAVRKSFKHLALIHHPDKADSGREQEANDRFCEIQYAYEYCMSHLDPNAYDVVKGKNDKGWDGELPVGIFNANSAWWNELKGNEPVPVLEWASACQKALRFASVKLDKLERYMLNISYHAAYETFESWRRKHIEQPKEEERIQQDINALPTRLQRHARSALEAKRAASCYAQDNYQEDHDEESYFDTWEAINEEGVLPTMTWRDGHNSAYVGNTTTPQQYFALFRKQVAALERRSPTFGIEDRSPEDEKLRRDRRNATEARPVQAVKRDEQINHGKTMKKKVAVLTKYAKDIGPSVRPTAAALEKEPVSDSLEADAKVGRKLGAWAAEASPSLGKCRDGVT